MMQCNVFLRTIIAFRHDCDNFAACKKQSFMSKYGGVRCLSVQQVPGLQQGASFEQNGWRELMKSKQTGPKFFKTDMCV